MRDLVNSAMQRKYFIMFFTSIIYIVGLFAYFINASVLVSFILLILGIAAIAKNYISPKMVLFWYFMFFFGFFNASLRIKNSDVLYQLAPQEAVITGQITSIPTSNVEDKSKFLFNVSKISIDNTNKYIKARTIVMLNNSGKNLPKYNIGDTYTIKGKLRPPFKVSNPSQFDYGKYLKNFNIFTVFYANGTDCAKEKSKLSLKWIFLQKLNNIRNDILKTHANYLKSPNLEILGGIVFGDDAVSPPDYIKKAFVNSGLLHILAASGMNVAIIYGIWFFLLNKFKAPFNIIVSSGIFVIIFYSMMTGLGPSVIRAAIMLIFILLGKLMDRDAHSISLLSFVALLMLIYNPAYINDVGFQLSFLVTFGLLTTAPILFERLKALPNWLSGAIFIPIIAQIWVAPIQMYYFNSFSLYSIFANILIVPFVTVISFGGFLSAVLSLFKPIASSVCFLFDIVLNPILTGLVNISAYFSTLPHSLITTPHPSVFQIFLYYSLVIALTFLIKLGKNKKIIISFVILFVALIIASIKIPDNNLEIIAFDVQNADAFLIKTPQNKYFIIDSAKSGYNGSSSQAQFIMIKYLKDKGIKNIESFVITHFDSDHSGGAVDLMRNLNIKNVYINSFSDNSRISKNIYDYLKTHPNIKVFVAKNNDSIYFEPNLKIKTFNANIKNEDNENSIVTLVSNNNLDILFMADAGIVAFEKIQNHLPKDIEILKVGHHGAKNVIDKKMLNRINPKVAIISTGINNYGHPNSVTLDLLEAAKVKTFRTDKQNAIKIVGNKIEYKVLSFDKTKGDFIGKLAEKY